MEREGEGDLLMRASVECACKERKKERNENKHGESIGRIAVCDTAITSPF